MNFSIVLITKNEEKTLPRLIESVRRFMDLGGDFVVVDTGSTDSTVSVAKSLGCRVFSEGERFVEVVDKELAEKINQRFIKGEAPILKEGDKLFNYAKARNYAATLAKNDVVAMPDADETYTKLDLDKINQAIEEGVDQLEYNFVFSHDQFGNEAIKFLHSKFYNRTKMKWVGVVHEVLQGEGKRKFFNEDTIKLEHYQNVETNRSGYLRGLALDCYMNPDNDRNAHYFARELMWAGRPKSAMKEFERHIEMDKWLPEKAQSMIFIGDCCGQLNVPEAQIEWYNQAFYTDSSRRESLLRIASFYEHNKNYQAAIVYAKGALEIPWSPFYANNMAHYTHEPHEILYRSYGWSGNIEKAKEHLNRCLEYQPLNSVYLRDYRFYNTLPTLSFLVPTLGRPEGLQRCLDSIKALNYPQELISVHVLDGEGTVPEKVSKGVNESQGEWICYLANDTEIEPDALMIALLARDKNENRFVGFNSGNPNENEHFIIKRDIIDSIGEVFCTRMKHCGVDNLLWAKCSKLGEAMHCDQAIVKHNHFTQGAEFDEIYQKGWANVEEDRKILKEELAKLDDTKENNNHLAWSDADMDRRLREDAYRPWI